MIVIFPVFFTDARQADVVTDSAGRQWLSVVTAVWSAVRVILVGGALTLRCLSLQTRSIRSCGNKRNRRSSDLCFPACKRRG